MMLSLLHKSLEPGAPLADAITFLTAIKHVKLVSDDCNPAVEKIKDLFGSSKTRLYGLIFLKLALEQNSDVYVKANWSVALNDILMDSSAHFLKEYACEIYCIILPFMGKETLTIQNHLRSFSKELFPYLLAQIDESVEWSVAALKCVHASLKCIPQPIANYKENILTTILRKVSYTVSSEAMEIVADCYSELPNLQQDSSCYGNEWKDQFNILLNTLNRLLDAFLRNDPLHDSINKNDKKSSIYKFEDDDHDKSTDVYQDCLKAVRQYINLSKCCARMLSTKSRYSVEVPFKNMLILTSRLFQSEELKKVKPISVEAQIFCSCLSQMQLSTLTILESILENFSLLRYSETIAQILHSAVEASKLPNISNETISELHHAVWKLLKIFLQKYGSSVSADILKLPEPIIPDLLADINSEENKSSQPAANQIPSKSKKVAPTPEKKKCFDENRRKMCKEALKALEQLVQTGSSYFEKKQFEEIFNKVLKIAYSFHEKYKYPFPYDDGKCRKHLYRLLLALTLSSQMGYNELEQCGVGLLKRALRDPSTEVTGFCNSAMTFLNCKIYPKRLPKYEIPEKQDSTEASTEVFKCSDWTSDEFIPNLSLEDTQKINQTFHDPDEDPMLQEKPMEEGMVAMEDVMEAEPHYSESYVPECYVSKYAEQRGESSQHNGEDLILDTNQRPEDDSDDVDDVDEDDDDDDDDDDERSYIDERINQGRVLPGDSYIPSARKIHIVSQAHINPDNVPRNIDQEYEQLRPPCVKGESSNIDSNRRHLNGIRNVMPQGPSSSTQSSSLTNENGVFGCDEEDLEDEGEEEDEEEERPSFPSEKRIPEFCPPHPPSKRPKLESEESKKKAEAGERPKSPSLEEMKASFRCTEINPSKR